MDSILFKITFQQCPVLSPLKESPLQCKEPSKSHDACILKWLGYNSTFAEQIYWFFSDFRYSEEFPESQVAYVNSESKIAEEEREKNLRQVSIASLILPWLEIVNFFLFVYLFFYKWKIALEEFGILSTEHNNLSLNR